MPDREKVIKGLEVCTSIADGESCPKDCPYYQEVCYGYDQLMRDALELLKEQEEDKPRGHWMPYEPDKRGYTDGYIFMCSCCEKYSIRNNYPYCHWCGAKMEGR